ncbi:YbaB/EbfC family nucleoid-associated protein [Actinophytocola sp.]|uniref:YbaB/EbfC family nucleoid-associated protein n=1 Tax=Actinophytocola sp. TaxID=1872138 RepID=UPI002D56F76E|nr:YbaB/EbfC family nucleoid-associated protein [Actinophytocola sp.]HYQ66632.1 YbaB/EbfC family nucleoid-associated protein [Actinophytocola sp.]
MDTAGWTDPEVADMVAQLARQQDDVEQARLAIEAMTVQGRSRGHEVVATMRGTGELTEVTIDPDALRRYDAHDVGGLVVEAVRDAQRRLARATEARFAPILDIGERLTGPPPRVR